VLTDCKSVFIIINYNKPLFQWATQIYYNNHYNIKGRYGKAYYIKIMKTKSTVNKAGNYTKPTMRKAIFNRIKAGSKGGKPGQWSARKAQMTALAYKKAGGGYK